MEKYSKFFKTWNKWLNTIELPEKQLKELWFKYDQRNWLFYYENTKTKQQLHYVLDVCLFWSYTNIIRTAAYLYQQDSVYPYTIEDVKLLMRAIDEWYNFYDTLYS